MKICIKDILKAVDVIAPWGLAESWDNSGLQIGDPEAAVSHLGIALDVMPDVVDHAIESGMQCLLTHHPFIFRPLKTIDFSTPEGRIISKAAISSLSIISAHTNFDMAVDGLNDILAEKIGLEVTSPMIAAKGGSDAVKHSGIGRVGVFASETRLAELALKIKNALGLPVIRYAGNPDSIIRTAALCTGSGGSLVSDFIKTGTDVYISGDIKYHEARDVEVMGRAVIDTGHFGSEIIMVEAMADRLRKFFASSGNEIKITEIRCEKEPFVFL